MGGSTSSTSKVISNFTQAIIKWELRWTTNEKLMRTGNSRPAMTYILAAIEYTRDLELAALKVNSHKFRVP